MMLNILKCRKDGIREKKNVRMPPQTSAQYLEASWVLKLLCVALDAHATLASKFSALMITAPQSSAMQAGMLTVC